MQKQWYAYSTPEWGYKLLKNINMTFSNTVYFIEVKEADGTTKRVPHTDKKHCNFLEGKKATNFLKSPKREASRAPLPESKTDHHV